MKRRDMGTGRIMTFHSWCLNTGKWMFRCRCRNGCLAYCDEAPVELLESRETTGQRIHVTETL